MTEPIVRPRVWDEIWQGRSPDPLVVASVAAAERAVLGAAGASAVAHEMAASVLGAGPLEPVLAWTGLTDLAVNADGSVWADTGQGMRQTDVIVGEGHYYCGWIDHFNNIEFAYFTHDYAALW